jgi:hypothetical protein
MVSSHSNRFVIEAERTIADRERAGLEGRLKSA